MHHVWAERHGLLIQRNRKCGFPTSSVFRQAVRKAGSKVSWSLQWHPAVFCLRESFGVWCPKCWALASERITWKEQVDWKAKSLLLAQLRGRWHIQLGSAWGYKWEDMDFTPSSVTKAEALHLFLNRTVPPTPPRYWCLLSLWAWICK